MEPKNMKKAEELQHVKIDKIGQMISGTFLSISKSLKYDDGYALKYKDEEGAPSVSFINNQGMSLFESVGIQSGQKFMLEFKEERENQDKKYKYRVFDLYYSGD